MTTMAPWTVTNLVVVTWICFTLPTVTAFVPVALSSPPSVAVRPTELLASNFNINRSGNLVDRLSRVVRGKVNRVVANWEDPEKVITQTVTEMQVGTIQTTACIGLAIKQLLQTMLPSLFLLGTTLSLSLSHTHTHIHSYLCYNTE